MMYTHFFSRWNNVLNPELRPKSWTYEEDKELLRLIQVYGIGEFVLFVLFVLRPKSTAMVMVGWSVNLTTLFPG